MKNVIVVIAFVFVVFVFSEMSGGFTELVRILFSE